MGQRSLVWIAAGIGVALGFVAGRTLPPAPPPPPPDVARVPSIPTDPPALAQTLERERDARESLEAELTALRAQLEAEESEGTEDDAPDVEAGVGAKNPQDELLAAGFPAHEVQRLQDRFEAFELDLLYLQDQANREGWNTGRLQAERHALRLELRTEVGDEDYDTMLYGAGRKNRVVAGDVLAGSAAESAGLRVGDAILQYGDERIFDTMSLLRATREGEAGAPTEVRVERDGRTIRVFVPRGPIGIRLGRASRLPDRVR